MVTIHTLGMAKELKAAGFSEGQAEAVVRVVGRAQSGGFSELATKSDVREAELRLEGKLAETRADLLKWAMGAIGVQTLVVIGAVVVLARALGG